MKTCIICLRSADYECGIEVCPNRCEHKHIGVGIGSNDATAVAIISPTGELEELATSEQEAITFEQLDRDCQHLKPSCYFRRTN